MEPILNSSQSVSVRVCYPSFTACMVQIIMIKGWLQRIGEFPHFQTFLLILDT